MRGARFQLSGLRFQVSWFRVAVSIAESVQAPLGLRIYLFSSKTGSVEGATGRRVNIFLLVRSHEERRCSIMGPTQSRISPSIL